MKTEGGSELSQLCLREGVYMIPIKIETLLEGRKVEQNRIEYKEGFNPTDLVHTICAYANDIAGVDGGYLVIGVRAEKGIPVLPPVGLPNELLDEIQLKIFQYCNKIEPRYIPKIDVVEYKGVHLIYLKCAAGDAGPYQAPVDVYSKKESGKGKPHYEVLDSSGIAYNRSETK